MNIVSEKLLTQIREDYLRQFMDNQKKLGAAGESVPSDPMKYVDASLLARAMST